MTPSRSKITAWIARSVIVAAARVGSTTGRGPCSRPARSARRCLRRGRGSDPRGTSRNAATAAAGRRAIPRTATRPGLLGRRQRPTVDRSDEPQSERGRLVGLAVNAPEDLAIYLEAEQAVAGLRLQRELADRQAIPAHELRRRARPLPRDVHPDECVDQAGVRRNEDRVADRRLVAPDDPAMRIRLCP